MSKLFAFRYDAPSAFGDIKSSVTWGRWAWWMHGPTPTYFPDVIVVFYVRILGCVFEILEWLDGENRSWSKQMKYRDKVIRGLVERVKDKRDHGWEHPIPPVFDELLDTLQHFIDGSDVDVEEWPMPIFGYVRGIDPSIKFTDEAEFRRRLDEELERRIESVRFGDGVRRGKYRTKSR